MGQCVIGVVGPSDLVPIVADIVDATAGIDAERLAYRHERETPRLIRDHTADVEAWLFTGVVPHEIAGQAGVVDKPAAHVSYSGASLLGALLRLVRDGRDVTRLSIDTLLPQEVTETLTEAGIPADAVTTMTYRPGVRSRDIVAFHRAVRQERPDTVSLTCLRSAYVALHGEMPVVRLTPTPRDTRVALDALLLAVRSRHHSDAQVALGFVDLEGDGELGSQFGALGGTAVKIDTGRYLLVTTRGPLERATSGLTAAPFLTGLAASYEVVRVGFGLGRSAGEAVAHASRALARARRHGPVAAVVSTSAETDVVLHRTAAETTRPDPGVLARRLGISRQTLHTLRELVEGHGGQATSRDVAEVFGIQDRSARRLLKRLERGGAATQVGTVTDGQMGRPPVVYRVDL